MQQAENDLDEIKRNITLTENRLQDWKRAKNASFIWYGILQTENESGSLTHKKICQDGSRSIIEDKIDWISGG